MFLMRCLPPIRMHPNYYVDTCIWRDYFEDRADGMRPLGAFAFQFLDGCLQRNIPLITTDNVIRELRKYYSAHRINQVFQSYISIIRTVEVTKMDWDEAKRLSRTRVESHLEDILHAVVARNHGCILITRDKGFDSLRDVIPVQKPEEVTFG